MFTSHTISHIHESSIVAESNTEYQNLVNVPQKCTLISHLGQKNFIKQIKIPIFWGAVLAIVTV